MEKAGRQAAKDGTRTRGVRRPSRAIKLNNNNVAECAMRGRVRDDDEDDDDQL